MAFDTSRDEFPGTWRGNNNPIAVEEGKSRNSVASGWYPIASQQINVTLAPARRKNLCSFLLLRDPKDDKWEAPNVDQEGSGYEGVIGGNFAASQQVDAAFAQLNAYWDMSFSPAIT